VAIGRSPSEVGGVRALRLTELTKTQEIGRQKAGIFVFACDVRVVAEVGIRVLRKLIKPP
jgi:hypothetical protein